MTGQPMNLCGLEAVTKGAAADIRINDIPATMVGLPSGMGRAFVPVPHLIVRGTNRVVARVRTMPGEAPPHVDIRVALFADGDIYFSNAGRELVRLDWAGPVATATLIHDFQADFGPPRWAWSECTSWTSAADALADATPFVRDLARAYFASDAGWMERVSTPKFADLALAFSAIPEAEMKQVVAHVITASPPEPMTGLAPPRPVLCGDGHLLMLVDDHNRPWLRKPMEPDGAEILIGKYRSEWQIIR